MSGRDIIRWKTVTSVEVINFGCRLNSYESELIRELFKSKDISLPKDKQLVIFNSCAVTKQAENQLCQAARKIRRERGADVIIGVVGCAVQVNRERYLAMKEVDFIIGNNDKLEIANYLNFSKNKSVVSDVFERNKVPDNTVTAFENRSRAFVQIQNGCNNKCAFCLARLARGYSVSAPSQKVIEQIKKLRENGYNEIVLTGVDVSDYGAGLDEEINLGLLVQKILKKTDLPRLRISSIDIAKLNEDLADVYKYEKRLMPHIHLSLQSGDNVILTRMLRRHRREETLEKCHSLKKSRNDIIFGADMIAGFPTETDAMHENSLDIVRQIPIVFGHIFPYSARPETKAALMPQVNVDKRKERAAELRSECERNLNILKKSVNETAQKVLVEEKFIGRLENYLKARLEEDHEKDIGKIVEAKVNTR